MQKIKLILIFLILFTFNGLFAQWIQTNGPIGGDEMPEFNYCKNKLYAGTVSGLYSSIDNGINWTKEDFDFPQQEVSFISVKDSNIIAGFANGYTYFYNYNNGSWEKLKIKLLEGETIKFNKVSNELIYVTISVHYKLKIVL